MLSVGESRGLELTDTESGDTVLEVLEPARRASMQKLEDIVFLLLLFVDISALFGHGITENCTKWSLSVDEEWLTAMSV